MSEAREDLYALAALLADLERVLNPALHARTGTFTTEPNIPPPLPSDGGERSGRERGAQPGAPSTGGELARVEQPELARAVQPESTVASTPVLVGPRTVDIPLPVGPPRPRAGEIREAGPRVTRPAPAAEGPARVAAPPVNTELPFDSRVRFAPPASRALEPPVPARSITPRELRRAGRAPVPRAQRAVDLPTEAKTRAPAREVERVSAPRAPAVATPGPAPARVFAPPPFAADRVARPIDSAPASPARARAEAWPGLPSLPEQRARGASSVERRRGRMPPPSAAWSRETADLGGAGSASRARSDEQPPRHVRRDRAGTGIAAETRSHFEHAGDGEIPAGDAFDAGVLDDDFSMDERDGSGSGSDDADAQRMLRNPRTRLRGLGSTIALDADSARRLTRTLARRGRPLRR